MTTFDIAIIGTGPHPDADDEGTGFSMGYRHARGYDAFSECRLHACADIVPEHAETFANEFDIDSERIFADHRTMLTETDPDIVSICTPPASHLEIVEDCARSESVSAIHCEKPMAETWNASRQMVRECERRDVQLTFNLQNRCDDPARTAKELLEDGAIGSLERLELSRNDLLQTGIHQIDLCNYFTDDASVEWVLGQMDYRDENVWYTGMYSEDQSFGAWQYDDGVNVIGATGALSDVVGCHNRLVGTDGVIELRLWSSPTLRVKRAGSAEWEAVDCEQGAGQRNAMRDVVEALETGDPSALCGEHALAATEVVFALWESSRRRSRVDLPLEIEGNPLRELVEADRQ